MYQAARMWRCAGFLMLGGVLLSGISAFGADEPPLSDQLTDLGRQALAQGASNTAQTFFEKALTLDPSQRGRSAGPERDRTLAPRRRSRRVSRAQARPGSGWWGRRCRDHSAPPPAEKATIEQSQAAENIARQQLTNDVEQRMASARALLELGPCPRPRSMLSA